jgi:O-antigen/teichoic acid export membrane protein
VQYAIGDYFGALCVLGSITILPLLVIRVAGVAENAYFYMSATIGFALYLISPNMGSSLIVEAVRDQAKLSVYSRKVFLQTLRIVVPLAGILIIGAPLILRIFGDNYAIEGSLLLRLLALSAIPNVVNTLYVSVARAQGRSGVVFVVSALLSGSILVLSYIFLTMYGIAGVGLAWTISQGICAVILFITQLRPLWAARVNAAKETLTGDSHSRSIITSAGMARTDG